MISPRHPSRYSDMDGHAYPRSIILLGASNIARAFPTLVHTLREGFPDPLPLEIHAAMGHGRSYGMWSRFLGRALPGILDCQIWSRLPKQAMTGPRPLAIIADLGNDLVYGADVSTLLGWLEEILRRLRAYHAAIVMMSLPMGRLARMTPAQFAWTRRLLFPGREVTWNALQTHIEQLDQGMRLLGRRHGLAWVEAPARWYGIDPIHIRRAYWHEAWGAVFSHWPGWRPGRIPPTPGFLESLNIRRLRPAEWRLFGRDFRTPQPARSQADYRLFLF